MGQAGAVTGGRTTSRKRPGFRSDVQGLRALAVAIVVLYHAGLSFPGGFVGVDVFFVISGFVIMRSMLHELEQTNSINLKAFALRRVRRLLPAFALLLVVVLPVSVLVGPVVGTAAGFKTAIAATLFNANTYLSLSADSYFSSNAELNPLLHTWSLSLEEQFYFVFPTASLFAWKLGARFFGSPRRGLCHSLILASVASLGLSILFLDGFIKSGPFGTTGASLAFYAAPLRAWEFGVGALLALVPLPKISYRLASMGGVAGIAVLGAASLTFSSPGTVFPGMAAGVPVAAAGLLIVFGETGAIAPILNSSLFQRLGDLSYGWYLWHWPVIVFVRAITLETRFESVWVAGLAAFAALVPAQVSMTILENPIRRNSGMRTAAVVAMGLAATVLSAMIALGSMQVWNNVHEDELAAFESQASHHLDLLQGCDNSPWREPVSDTECEFVVEGSLGEVALVGDSNAGHFSAGVVAGARSAGYDLRLSTFSACPFADVEVVLFREPVAGCVQYVEDTTAQLIEADVDLVIIGHAADVYYTEARWHVVAPISGELIEPQDERRELLADGFYRSVLALTAHDIDVIVIHPTPRPHGWDPAGCSMLRLRRASDGCAGSFGGEDLQAWRDELEVVNERIVDAGGVVVDLSDAWCTDDLQCQTGDGDVTWFRDPTHLSVHASEELADEFSLLISRQSPTAVLPFVDAPAQAAE